MKINKYNEIDAIEIKEIVKNLIYSPGVFVLYGKPKCGKSHFALQLAVEINNRFGILFDQEKFLKEKKSLFVSTELTSNELKLRLDKYYNDYNNHNNINILLAEYQGHETIKEQIINIIQEYNINFVVIDMIIDTIIQVDINKANEVNNIIQQYKNIANTYNCSFLFIMHSNENNNNALAHSQAFRRKSDGYMYFEQIESDKFTLTTNMRNIKSTIFTFNRNDNLLYSIHNKVIQNTTRELNEIIKFVSSQKNREYKGSNQDILNACNISNINSTQLGLMINRHIDTLRELGLTINVNGKNKNRKIWKYKEPNNI